jgi:hypothetical protein
VANRCIGTLWHQKAFPGNGKPIATHAAEEVFMTLLTGRLAQLTGADLFPQDLLTTVVAGARYIR